MRTLLAVILLPAFVGWAQLPQQAMVPPGATAGTVTASGTPLVNQVPIWTTDTDIKGLAVGTTGKPLVGATGADPVWSKVTLTNPATAATLTLADGSSLITAGAYAATLTLTGATGVTLPTSGTLATTAGISGTAPMWSLTQTDGTSRSALHDIAWSSARQWAWGTGFPFTANENWSLARYVDGTYTSLPLVIDRTTDQVEVIGLTVSGQKSTTGQRYVCIDTDGKLISSANACSGT
jgi:hypothetical protein